LEGSLAISPQLRKPNPNEKNPNPDYKSLQSPQGATEAIRSKKLKFILEGKSKTTSDNNTLKPKNKNP
jgi:hypothetical protein